MKKLSILLISILAVFFSACSSKQVYKPKVSTDDWSNYGSSNEKIVDVASDVALLEDGRVRKKDKIIDAKVENSYRLIGISDGWLISSSVDGNLTLQFIEDKSMMHKFKLKKTIAAASVKDDTLAVLFADNEMALYTISTKKLLLKEQGTKVVAVDSRIVNPHFMNDLVLFLTLDGKVVIVNAKQKKKLRTIIISSEEYFNNVIYFNVLDDKLIAATGHKIFSMAKKEIRVNYEVRDIAYDKKNIYISTKQGEIISLTPTLEVNAKLKFPFAHFLGLIIAKDNIYALEKEGYIMEISKDLSKYKVYEVDVEEGFVFVGDKAFYVDDEYIQVK